MQGYTRRQLKEDKFAQGAQGAMYWATEHRQAVVWTIVLILVIAIVLIGFLTWSSHQTDQANAALGAAMRTFTTPLRQPGTPANETQKSFNTMAERGKEAEKEFRNVADKYSMTKPGKLAGYMAGVAAMQAGDNAGAEKQLKSAADSRDQCRESFRQQNIASVEVIACHAGALLPPKGSLYHSEISCESAAMSVLASGNAALVCQDDHTHVQIVVPARSLPAECSPRMTPLVPGVTKTTPEDQKTSSFVGGRCMRFTRFGTTSPEK